MSEKIKLIEDILSENGFTLRWEILPHWVDVVAFEKVGIELGEPPKTVYPRKDGTSSEHLTLSLEDAEPYLSGFVKWDGCTELDQGSTHWCGLSGYKNHCDLLQYIYTRSQQLMSKTDHELFGGPWQ